MPTRASPSDARFVAPGEEARYEPTTGLAYLLMKLREAQGES